MVLAVLLLLLAAAAAAAALAAAASALRRLWLLFRLTGAPSFSLPVPVSRLGPLDVAFVVLLLALKYPYRLLGLLPPLRPDLDGDGARVLLPDVSAVAKLRVTARDLGRFAAAAGRPDPVMVLPALVNPLLALLLANRNCPVLPLGCVNTANVFDMRDPALCRDPTALNEDNCIVTASLGGPRLPARRVRRGLELDVRIAIVRFGAHGRGSSVFEQVATILAFLPPSAKPVFRPAGLPADEPRVAWSAAPDTAPLRLGPSAPPSWAAVCKDYNPIHMSRPLAKLFGFPGVIAHGNHVLAVALRQLPSAPPRPHRAKADTGATLHSASPLVLRVAFKRPMVLPFEANIEHGLLDDDDGMALRVVGNGKEYLVAYTAHS